MYQEKKEIVLFGVDPKPLKPFVPEFKIRMNKGKVFDVDKVTSSKEVYGILKRIYGHNPIQENFVMLLFNRANKLIGYYKHTIGSTSATIVDIPMLIGLATKALSQGIVISHNHPSGTLAPSEPDKELTRNITQALKTVKINLLDHLIYTNDGYYSFADEGTLNGLNNTAMITKENIISEYPGIDQTILPDALKKDEFEFIQENIDLYNDDETIKKYIDTFVEKLNEVINKHTPEKKAKNKKSKPQKTPKEPDVEKSSTEETTTSVEKVSLEVTFIKRYVGLHRKTKDKSQILNLLNSLQKAIIEKRIRKTSVYASEIENIQTQLIKCYNQMGNTIKVNLNEGTLDKYTTIAQSQKTMLSVTYIKQFISIHGKKDVKDKAKALLNRIEKAIESGKIPETCPYWNEIQEIKSSLERYLTNKSKVPVITENTLNGIMSWMARRQQKKKVAKYLQKIYETERGLRGVEPEQETNLSDALEPVVIPSTELAGMDFETIGLKGKYKDLIGDPSIGFSAMVFGLPKSGKSTLCIDFAKYLAENHGKVLYVAIEEGFGYTLKEKFKRLWAIHPNLVIAEKLPDDLSPYQFIFIDSVSKAGLSSQELTRLRKENPKTAFIFIFHTTKEGNFRGKQDFAHDVDVIIEVENGVAKANGRFGVGGKLGVFE
ncbi:MAG: JAB domain-containing protein [Breznakibacter sp.]